MTYCKDSKDGGWCCGNEILDLVNPKCSVSDCSNGKKASHPSLRYLICPNNNFDKCGAYKTFIVSTKQPVTLEVTPLGYTEYCDYTFKSNSFNFSQAIYLEVATQYLADVTFFTNISGNSDPAPIVTEAREYRTYKFGVRDTILAIVRSNSSSLTDFIDLA